MLSLAQSGSSWLLYTRTSSFYCVACVSCSMTVAALSDEYKSMSSFVLVCKVSMTCASTQSVL